ncbi:ABC-type antimicrobial peptide transport system, permease component [Secundilactobacillus oryzae JCM 18671]|uniref:ABC-type antimicrobial peptide transport system, permease component n=1 Tax=Secundilactobacillus oryzae JCM 18671 TaxID=1291743 RepID=A0A081BGG9_9LACO|nr:ABC transporter permease [Secundilactobacillus oryzae]GAK47137.1 ABC-type antimicrobial peptide transport system, permease component [Secundilactobacillus oryzae JCM 18671]
MFLLKLAAQNLRKNNRTYLPFYFSMIFLVALNTVTQLVVRNPGMKKLYGADEAIIIFNLGAIIVIIFSIIFSIYTNSFLLKQRTKEFGLYNVLGLGKRELYRMVAFENLLTFALTMLGGLLTGLVFAKLSFLILRKIIGATATFTFSISGLGLLIVIAIFVAISLVQFLLNAWQIHRMNPVNLLHSNRSGERVPKSHWLMTIVAFVSLGVGYYWAVTINNPVEAIILFFFAILLVILGTYALFMAGSVTLLKFLKKRPNYYYKANHFISVSNMIYRMKQNAAGLASIAILSTMVLVTLAITISLYVGQQDMLRDRYPYDVTISAAVDDKATTKAIEQVREKYDIEVTNQQNLVSTTDLPLIHEGNRLVSVNRTKSRRPVMLRLMTAAEYERVTGRFAKLNPHQVITYELAGKYDDQVLTIGKQRFDIKQQIHSLPHFKQALTPVDTLIVVMPNTTVLNQVLAQNFGRKQDAYYRQMVKTTVFNVATKDPKVRTAFNEDLKQAVSKQTNGGLARLDIKDDYKKSSSVLIGGFLFLGLIFGLAFILATALIIYYKQISEGLDDKIRFNILQKVGMDHDFVKRVIHSQILIVFFFPIAVAAVHLTFAFPFIKSLLLLFGLSNTALIIGTTVASAVGFMIIYFIVYQLTAKVYYRLVER